LEAVLRRTSVFDLLALSVSTQPRPTYQASPNQTQIGKRRIKTILGQFRNNHARQKLQFKRKYEAMKKHIRGARPNLVS
jgi:hypothetical protein